MDPDSWRWSMVVPHKKNISRIKTDTCIHKTHRKQSNMEDFEIPEEHVEMLNLVTPFRRQESSDDDHASQ